LREGAVRFESAGGPLALRPGQTAVLKKGAALPPVIISGVVYAAETIWRAWESLVPDERAERLDYLKAELSKEDYDARVAAREPLRAAGAEGLAAAAAWTTAPLPRLRLEAVLFLRGAPEGHPEARQALRELAADNRESLSLRQQALASLGGIGTAEDLPFLDPERRLWNEDREALRQAAAAAHAQIRLRLEVKKK
jgi:hypothetical protein